MSRRAGYGFALASCALFLSCEGLQTATADGDTRTISLHHLHTGEDLTITYKRNGRYDDDALKKINWVLRDWRREEEIRMDPLLLDTLWDVNREVGGKEAIRVICGYRAPQTNAMLRRRSGGVAQFSQHMLGKAIDFAIPGVPLEDIRAAGLRLQRGGVGFYPSSGSAFVHLDVGSIRHWPRMTHDQLVKVFPTGRTVHVPSDGKPLPGYALALADVEKRGSKPSAISLAAAQRTGVTAKQGSTFLAKLFGSNAKEEDDEVDAAPAQTPAPAAKVNRPPAVSAVAAADDKTRAAQPANVPVPQARPVTFALASAPAQPQTQNPSPRPAQAASLVNPASLSPNEIIGTRGYWQGLPESGATEMSARATRRETKLASAETTASVSPLPPAIRGERGSGELALAYAPASEPQPANRSAPMGAAVARAQNPAPAATAALPAPKAAAPADTTVAVKQTKDYAALPVPQAAAPVSPGNSGPRFDDPWLRAMVLAPSMHNSIHTTLFGATDFRNLRPLLYKPANAVLMTFSNDPHLGTIAERFTGPAIVFMPTVTFVRMQVSEIRN